MTEVATYLTANQGKPNPVVQIEKQSGYVRYLVAMALILIGGIVTVVWIAFLGWAAGKVFNLW